MFWDCSALRSVDLPIGITDIAYAAFQNCAALQNIDLPEGLRDLRYLSFSGCSSLTSITFPNSVTNIEGGSFRACIGLTHIDYPDGLTIISDAFWGSQSLTKIDLPETSTRIGDDAFRRSGLESIAIPESVTHIGIAFTECPDLTAAIFLGDAPTIHALAFRDADPAFTCYYFSGASGFTSPTWNGHPTVEIGSDVSPELAVWLLAHGLPPETNLDADTNGDGVNLLMAYALDLDPTLNLSASLPRVEVDSDSIAVTYFASRPGIRYSAQTSRDLRLWTTDGVLVSDPDPHGRRTASVTRDAGQGYLRIAVEME